MINIETKRETSESNIGLARRFSKKVIGASILKRAKNLKARKRPLSHFKKKKTALHRIAKRAEIERLWKLGKITLNT